MRPILTVQQSKKLPQVRENEMSRLKSLKPPSSCTDAYWMLGKQ